MQPSGLSFAHGIGGAPGSCSITRCGSRTLDGTPHDLERVAKELGADSYQCLTVLPATDYQLLLVEAPNVPALELKTAMRWRIKDMLDYHVEDATIDVLDIPVDAAGGSRNHSMYVVAARNDLIQGCIERFTVAHVPLTVIDIAETAQRNIAALFEPPNRGVALLYLGQAQALLTISFRGELYLARRIDVGADQILATSGASREELMNRIVLELQRSFDHLDRQFPFVALSKLELAPEPGETGLAAHLTANLGVPVEQASLGQVISFAPGVALEGNAAWRLFHVIGAALRHELKAL
jgi:MSHA biogenesis protein MshI